MGFLIKLVPASVLAIVLGLGSAWLLVGRIAESQFVANGAWRIAPDAGSAKAGLYSRAAIAKAGLLALPRSEALYLSAHTDDSGAPLNGACTYRVEGSALPAAWWSLTVYGADEFLVANDAHRYSVLGSEAMAPDGHFTIALSPAPAAGNWLPTGGAKRFSLTLRLYLPSAAAANPTAFAAPHIVKGACP